jgi:hypothetical protein
LLVNPRVDNNPNRENMGAGLELKSIRFCVGQIDNGYLLGKGKDDDDAKPESITIHHDLREVMIKINEDLVEWNRPEPQPEEKKSFWYKLAKLIFT